MADDDNAKRLEAAEALLHEWLLTPEGQILVLWPNARHAKLRDTWLGSGGQLLDPRLQVVQAVNRRLDELAIVTEMQPTETALTCARSVLGEVCAAGIPKPGIFPTPQGGIQAEWEFNNWSVEVFFRPQVPIYSGEATSSSSDEERVLLEPLVEKEQTWELINWLKEMMP